MGVYSGLDNAPEPGQPSPAAVPRAAQRSAVLELPASPLSLGKVIEPNCNMFVVVTRLHSTTTTTKTTTATTN